MSELFSPYRIGALELANRIIVSPMCQYSAVDGCAGDWHAVHLGGLAIGGAALLFVEATAVLAEGRITPGCLGLYDDANEEALARVLRMIRQCSPIKMGIQLAHAGRKGSSAAPWDGGGLLAAAAAGGWQPVAPSALAHAQHEAPPHALTRGELDDVRAAFVASAKRAVRLGFEAIELHAAHGYLLHQFLSPVSNRRTDDYGGTLENRMRFPREVFSAVRAVLPDHIPLGVRVSATDWLEDSGEDSWTIEQTVTFGQALQNDGCAFLDVSSGGISPQQKIQVGPGYQVRFARELKEATGLPIVAVGMITDALQAEEIIGSGSADLVALARAMLYDPRWAWHAAARLGGVVSGPRQYWRSLPSGSGRIFGDVRIAQR